MHVGVCYNCGCKFDRQLYMRNMLVRMYKTMVFVAFIFESFVETIEIQLIHLHQSKPFYSCIIVASYVCRQKVMKLSLTFIC